MNPDEMATWIRRNLGDDCDELLRFVAARHLSYEDVLHGLDMSIRNDERVAAATVLGWLECAQRIAETFR